MNGRTIHLETGKYVFVINANGVLTGAFRNGEVWPAGLEMGRQKAFMSALNLISELYDEIHNRMEQVTR